MLVGVEPGPGWEGKSQVPSLKKAGYKVWICLSLGNALKARGWGAPGSWLSLISGKAKGAGLWELAGEQPGGQVFVAPE